MDVTSRFADSTQYALRKLDTDRTDQGLTVKELKTIDTDGDNTISTTEGACVGITSEKDLVRINEALQNAQGNASPCLELDVFGCEEETENNLVVHRDAFNKGAIVVEGALGALSESSASATRRAAEKAAQFPATTSMAKKAAKLAAMMAPIPSVYDRHH